MKLDGIDLIDETVFLGTKPGIARPFVEIYPSQATRSQASLKDLHTFS